MTLPCAEAQSTAYDTAGRPARRAARRAAGRGRTRPAPEASTGTALTRPAAAGPVPAGPRGGAAR